VSIETILVPTDFSDDARAALEAAIDLAESFDARLVVVHAYYVDIPAVYGGVGGISGDFLVPGDVVAPVREGAEQAVETLLEELRGRGIEADGSAVMRDAAGAILQEAERVGADLIVMGTRGLTGFKHVLLGSVAERIARTAPCPVMTVKAER
jgi:nucleotide-binding universal stress UspA family protein